MVVTETIKFRDSDTRDRSMANQHKTGLDSTPLVIL